MSKGFEKRQNELEKEEITWKIVIDPTLRVSIDYMKGSNLSFCQDNIPAKKRQQEKDYKLHHLKQDFMM